MSILERAYRGPGPQLSNQRIAGPLTFFAVNTPTKGAMNSGLSPLSMSGGMMVSVMAEAAIYMSASLHIFSVS